MSETETYDETLSFLKRHYVLSGQDLRDKMPLEAVWQTYCADPAITQRLPLWGLLDAIRRVPKAETLGQALGIFVDRTPKDTVVSGIYPIEDSDARAFIKRTYRTTGNPEDQISSWSVWQAYSADLQERGLKRKLTRKELRDEVARVTGAGIFLLDYSKFWGLVPKAEVN